MLVYMGHDGSSLTQSAIEKMRKKYRCHRDMSRSERAFIEGVWRGSVGIELEIGIKEELLEKMIET